MSDLKCSLNMETMKRFVKIIAVAAVGMLSALNLPAKNGVEVGYLNSTYMTKTDSGESVKSEAMSGFYVGLVKDMRLFAGLSIQPGLYYSFLNSTSKNEVPMFNLTNSYTEHGLNLPIHIKYTFDIVPAFGVYVFAGPTLSLGLAATTKMSVTGDVLGNQVNGSVQYDSYTGKLKSDNISEENMDRINEYMPDSRMNRFDVLMGGGVGLNFINFITVKGGVDYGLLNRFKGDLAETGTMNRLQFYVSVGIMF